MEYLLALPIHESSIQLSKEETQQILEYFKNSNVCIKKYELFILNIILPNEIILMSKLLIY